MKLVISMLENIFVLHTKIYKHMTFVIGMLKNIFPLHTNTQEYHLKCPNAIL